MTTQEAYGFCCLGIGALLTLGQIYVLLRANSTVADVSRAATQTKDAAERNAEVVRKLRSAASSIMVAGQDETQRLDAVYSALASAEEAAESTKTAAEEAESKAEDWRSTLVSNLSSRIPLATAGILLIILGAVINGYIDLSAGNTAGPSS